MSYRSERSKKRALFLASVATVLLTAGIVYAAGGDAGHGGGHGVSPAQLKDLGWRVLNFAVLAAILIWAIKKANVKGSLADRQAQIEKNLREAREAREAAEAKLAEYNGKLAKANMEVETLRISMMKDAEAEKQRIVAEAAAAAKKLVEQAAQAADQEVLKARTELRAEAARLAVEMAAGRLAGAVQKADHDRFVDEYLGKVGQL